MAEGKAEVITTVSIRILGEMVMDNIAQSLSLRMDPVDDQNVAVENAVLISKRAQQEFADILERVKGNRPNTQQVRRSDMRQALEAGYQRCIEILNDPQEVDPSTFDKWRH